jgi:hypothetical protein
MRTLSRPADVIKLRIRVQWQQDEGQAACFAANVSLPGIGLSIVDPVTSRVVRELAYVHVTGIEVCVILYTG